MLECGYLAPVGEAVDRRNRYTVPARVLAGSPQPPTKCNFKFEMISELRRVLESETMPVIVRGIASVDDALRAAESGASAVWLSEKNHFKSSTSPISILHNIAQCMS